MREAAVSAAGGPQRQARRPLAWLLLFRVLVVSLLLGGTMLYQWRSNPEHPADLRPFYLIALLSYAEALASALLLASTARIRLFIQVQVVWDLLVAIVLIWLTGGVASPFPFLLLLVISAASVFLPRRDVFIVAAAAAILYGSLLDLQYYRYLPEFGGVPTPTQIETRDVFYAVYIHVTAFLVTALLSGLLADRLRRSEQAREQSEIDVREIENLNRAIQTNISSGLLIVNPAGRIRSFNREAERITGFRLAEVYDRPLTEVFSLFASSGHPGELSVTERAEGRFLTPQGRELVLGFRISEVYNRDGEALGKMVNFQDLTRLKTMEEQIKRADRLAAVGKLASGMAHEIRNPLASISGSVQLLMEQDYIRDEDRRLMGIVVKEADRLSRLLSDFLAYARPPAPVRRRIDLAELIDDIIRIVKGDARFDGIAIHPDYPHPLWADADEEQFRQVLWNLLANAVEACGSAGQITVRATASPPVVEVEDSGPGVPEELRSRIFDPFFTTKDRGSGLGLATVYAIIDAHGGTIEAGRGGLGGARFTIQLDPSAGRTGITS